MPPTILTCTVTGTFPTRQHDPNLPVTPLGGPVDGSRTRMGQTNSSRGPCEDRANDSLGPQIVQALTAATPTEPALADAR